MKPRSESKDEEFFPDQQQVVRESRLWLWITLLSAVIAVSLTLTWRSSGEIEPFIVSLMSWVGALWAGYIYFKHRRFGHRRSLRLKEDILTVTHLTAEYNVKMSEISAVYENSDRKAIIVVVNDMELPISTYCFSSPDEKQRFLRLLNAHLSVSAPVNRRTPSNHLSL